MVGKNKQFNFVNLIKPTQFMKIHFKTLKKMEALLKFSVLRKRSWRLKTIVQSAFRDYWISNNVVESPTHLIGIKHNKAMGRSYRNICVCVYIYIDIYLSLYMHMCVQLSLDIHGGLVPGLPPDTKTWGCSSPWYKMA